MSDPAETTIQRHPLNDFGDRWKLDGDYIQCRGCKRPQQISWALHDFLHVRGCLNEGTERNPWRSLASLITAEIAKAKKPSDG